MRFLLGCGTTELLQPGGRVRTLIMADEYASLRLKDTDQIFATARKYNTQLWIGLQDVAQLKLLHPQTWETVLNNAGCIQWMGSNNAADSEYVSAMCGEIEVDVASRSRSYDAVNPAGLNGQ